MFLVLVKHGMPQLDLCLKTFNIDCYENTALIRCPALSTATGRHPRVILKREHALECLHVG